MPAMDRREMLKMTAVALQGQGFQGLHANGLDLGAVAGNVSAGILVGSITIGWYTGSHFVPVENVMVRPRLRGEIKAVTFMRSGITVTIKQDGDWIAVTVPRLLVYESIRVDFA